MTGNGNGNKITKQYRKDNGWVGNDKKMLVVHRQDDMMTCCNQVLQSY